MLEKSNENLKKNFVSDENYRQWKFDDKVCWLRITEMLLICLIALLSESSKKILQGAYIW